MGLHSKRLPLSSITIVCLLFVSMWIGVTVVVPEVAVGGMDNLWGALLMSMLLNFLSLRGYFGSYDDAVFAAILLVIMLFFPDGLLRAPGLRNLSVLRQKQTAVLVRSTARKPEDG